MGDTNGDGTVDLDDYHALRDNFGIGSTLAEGDVDLDGDVDQLDFNIIRTEYPKYNGGASLASAIPEPASLFLLGRAVLRCYEGIRNKILKDIFFRINTSTLFVSLDT